MDTLWKSNGWRCINHLASFLLIWGSFIMWSAEKSISIPFFRFTLFWCVHSFGISENLISCLFSSLDWTEALNGGVWVKPVKCSSILRVPWLRKKGNVAWELLIIMWFSRATSSWLLCVRVSMFIDDSPLIFKMYTISTKFFVLLLPWDFLFIYTSSRNDSYYEQFYPVVFHMFLPCLNIYYGLSLWKGFLTSDSRVNLPNWSRMFEWQHNVCCLFRRNPLDSDIVCLFQLAENLHSYKVA